MTWMCERDFIHDQLALGKKQRILTVVDTHSRLCPAADPRFSYRGEDVVRTLERVCGQIGYPKTIRVDNGSEFISRDLDLWAYANDVTLDFSRPGKPTDNGIIEAFNSKLLKETISDVRCFKEEFEARTESNAMNPFAVMRHCLYKANPKILSQCLLIGLEIASTPGWRRIALKPTNLIVADLLNPKPTEISWSDQSV